MIGRTLIILFTLLSNNSYAIDNYLKFITEENTLRECNRNKKEILVEPKAHKDCSVEYVKVCKNTELVNGELKYVLLDSGKKVFHTKDSLMKLATGPIISDAVSWSRRLELCQNSLWIFSKDIHYKN